MKEDSKPIFCKARPVPYALKPKVDEELKRLESEGVITKVDRSDWASPIVVVPKSDGSIRLCCDFKVSINQCIDVEQYLLPTTEDLFSTLAGGQYFSKLDLSSAYQQLLVEEDSRKYLTINTHRGLFQYNRLPFGVSSAPAIFQAKMDQILSGLEGVICYLDDILISGRSLKKHKENLTNVFKRLQQFGLRLKLTKCHFLEKEVEYLGHVINKEGLHPSPKKVDGIARAPAPKNTTELRAFLGSIQYYGKFVPQLSTLLSPLYELLQKNSQWKWTDKCEAAFLAAKAEISSDKVLTHYDVKLPIVLACDASQYGVGAVISHLIEEEEKPIAFSSRTLTKSEQNYSQLEKEALAIIFGIRKFHKYLYGRKFVLLTDHKPL